VSQPAVPEKTIYRSTEEALAMEGLSASSALEGARRSITLLERVLEALSHGVFALDSRGRIIHWSPGCARLTGVTKPEAIGSDAARHLGRLGERAQQMAEGRVSGNLSTAEGERPVRIDIVPAAGTGGVHLGKVCAIRDQRGETEASAEKERDAALVELGRGVAWAVHQIRNPLGAAAGFAELLSREVEASSSRPLLEKVRESLSEVDRRVGEILSYARPRPLEVAEMDLTHLIDHVIGNLSARFPHGPAIDREMHSAVLVKADWAQLQQALENLIVNAAEAAGRRGRVRILLQPAPGISADCTVRLLIRNTGGEVTPEILGTLFEPFRTRKSGGTGLGLPLAKRIIEGHGGGIEALSAGGWTTFVVTLPREAVVEAEDVAA